MNYDELNEYIKHYVEKDKTQSAIMLTGGWGTGKSYYIHNFLEPFLKEPQNGKHRCAIVSLYGLKNTSEISKRIYFELRTIGSPKKNEAKSTAGAAATVVAKTILNGLTSKIGFDIGSIKDEDLEKVYSSIDLSDTLVVFEDLERSTIDIIEILGYVNSLVEQDGAKVLLVANEDEISKFCNSQPDEDGNTQKIPDEKTKMYLRAKEKTISDIIIFESDIQNAIKNIISSFNNEVLNRFKSRDNVSEIDNIMLEQKNYNLRSFRCACQKAVDIFEKLKITENYILKTIFMGNVAFFMKINSGNFPNWDGDNFFSTKLGTDEYPLYSFCYDYIKSHWINVDKARNTFLRQKKQRLYNKNNFENDVDLKIVFSDSRYDYNRNMVISSLKNIETRLCDYGDISFYGYELLAYKLVKWHFAFGYDYSTCEERMIDNILSQKEGVDTAPFDWSIQKFYFENPDEKLAFFDFSKAIADAVNSTSPFGNVYSFLYNPQYLDLFYRDLKKNKEYIISDYLFISKFDLERLVKMIFECDASQIKIFREILSFMYENAVEKDFQKDDILFMERFKNEITHTLNFNSPEIAIIKNDNNKLLQISYLIDNLTEFILQLS